LAAAIDDNPEFFSDIQDSIDLKAPLDSPALTGVPTAPTAMAATNTTQVATTAFVQTKINNLVAGAPGLLDTLEELSAALGDDANFASTVTNSLALKADATYVDGALTTHASNTTLVHGIADTSLLATTSDVQDAADAAASALSTHASDTTLVHGIADTSLLATLSDVEGAADGAASALSTHAAETENVHGIADTSVLVTQSELLDAITTATVNQENLAGTGIDWNSVDERFDIDSTVATKTYADDAVSTHNSDTTSVHGIADTSLLATTEYADTAEADAISAAEAYTDLLVGDASIDGTTGNTVAAKIADVEDYVDSQIDAHVSVTTNVHGIADTTKIVLKDALSTTLDGALVIEGDLTVNGTNFAASATSITIEDNMLQLAHENAANTVDLGLVVAYNDGAAKHSGIVRDVSADSWKLFKGVTTEPSTTVDFTQGSLDDLALNNVTVAGVVFTDGTQSKEGVPSRTPIVQKTASYSLSQLTHRDSMIEVSSTSGTTITIPAEASVNYPVGTTIDILQTNTGQVTIAGAAGVTVNATPGLKLRTRWSSATLMKRAADTWVVYGDLTA
jgi:hypothetical protein